MDDFPENCGYVSDKKGQTFHQDMKVMDLKTSRAFGLENDGRLLLESKKGLVIPSSYLE